MDYPLQHDATVAHDHPLVRPWRNAALAAALVAVVELVLLVVVGGALLAKPEPKRAVQPATASPKKSASAPAASGKQATTSKPAAVARLARAKVTVLVLNGNGRQGAAAAEASRVTAKGYRIGGVANASSNDYTRTLVMYRPGFEGEGRRLARDLRIPIVGPLDGMRPGQLGRAHAVVIVGA
jgi:LytR cell envelope-related transcriptional attenuator